MVCQHAIADVTYYSRFDRRKRGKGSTHCRKDHWHNAHGDKRKLPMNSQRHDVGRKEQRYALNEGIQLLGDSLVDSVAVCVPRQSLFNVTVG